MSFEVPDKLRDIEGWRYCEDMIKVFVTTHETSLDILERPSVWLAHEYLQRARGRPESRQTAQQWCAFNFTVRTTLRVDGRHSDAE